MKCISVLLFVATAHGGLLVNQKVVQKPRSIRSTSSEEDFRYNQLFTCFTEKQVLVQDECWVQTEDRLEDTYVQNVTDCIKTNEASAENPSIKTLCMSHIVVDSGRYYSECVFQKIGEKSIVSDPIDLESFKTATLQATDLEDAKKTAALADFDACMKAPPSVPYSPYNFRSDKIPEMLQDYIHHFRMQFIFGQLTPPAPVLAMDCMETVLVQNGCGTTSEEIINDLMQEVVDPDEYEKTTIFQCLSRDQHWIETVCDDYTSIYLEDKWAQDCTKGSSDDSGCRVIRMKQILETQADCLIDKSKVPSTEYHHYLIGGSSLTDEQKAAAMASFDECMAKEVTPYRFFPFELEKIQGPRLMQNLTAMINKMFAIGNLPPTENIRISDCSVAALLLNGCDATTPDGNVMMIMHYLTEFDKMFTRKN